MPPREGALREGRWTRAGLLRAAAGAGAAVAGGAAIGGRGGGSLAASPSAGTDADILNAFLLLEHVQQDLYAQAERSGRLSGGLLRFARTVGRQEAEHVAFLTRRLGNRARQRPRTRFDDALSSPERFRDTAIDLEEATIGAYIAQGANLTRDAIAAIAPLLSVEARQVAWVRDLAGTSPAPRAADPARRPQDVIAQLRDRGVIA